MWLYELLKTLWTAYQTKRAAEAAAALPKGKEAINSIAADGKAIEAQLAAARKKSAK